MEMAWDRFWRESGMEWYSDNFVDKLLVVAFEKRKIYMGIDWDGAITLAVCTTNNRD